MPSATAIVIGLAALLVLRAVTRRWIASRVTFVLTIAALSVLTLIATKGLFYAAGLDWRDVVAHHHDMVSTTLISTIRKVKNIATICVVLLLWVIRARLSRLIRVLSSLGFAFGCLAIVKIALLNWNVAHAVPVLPTAGNFANPAASNTAGIPVLRQDRTDRSRRVVWVIFDETDLDLAFSREKLREVHLPNFTWLSHRAVFATDAHSPASATVFSIPALLMGSTVGGTGVEVDNSGTLSVEGLDGTRIPFAQSTTIFGALAASGRSFSILGFYHPYCKLFAATNCDSFAWPDVGGWAAGLLSNLPDSFSLKLPWDNITAEELRLLPGYVSRSDELTFLHLNFPHLPASYADRHLKLAPSSDPLIEYDHNVQLADLAMGEILNRLRAQKSRETLLVVSTDHWLRNQWYQASHPDVSRKIAFMAWKVDEDRGFSLSQPINTTHTASMILDYLNGRITTQHEILDWWNDKQDFPSFIAK